MAFAVCVTFHIKPESLDAFVPLMHENASTSLRNEEGCLRFDVCTDDEQAGEVFLYEVYTSPDAFQIHLVSEHFLKFDSQVKAMIADKQVKTFRTVI